MSFVNRVILLVHYPFAKPQVSRSDSRVTFTETDYSMRIIYPLPMAFVLELEPKETVEMASAPSTKGLDSDFVLDAFVARCKY